jgi:hypothetical protein
LGVVFGVQNGGEWMVDRGNLCGSCAVIFVVEKYANF